MGVIAVGLGAPSNRDPLRPRSRRPASTLGSCLGAPSNRDPLRHQTNLSMAMEDAWSRRTEQSRSSAAGRAGVATPTRRICLGAPSNRDPLRHPQPVHEQTYEYLSRRTEQSRSSAADDLHGVQGLDALVSAHRAIEILCGRCCQRSRVTGTCNPDCERSRLRGLREPVPRQGTTTSRCEPRAYACERPRPFGRHVPAR